MINGSFLLNCCDNNNSNGNNKNNEGNNNNNNNDNICKEKIEKKMRKATKVVTLLKMFFSFVSFALSTITAIVVQNSGVLEAVVGDDGSVKEETGIHYSTLIAIYRGILFVTNIITALWDGCDNVFTAGLPHYFLFLFFFCSKKVKHTHKQFFCVIFCAALGV